MEHFQMKALRSKIWANRLRQISHGRTNRCFWNSHSRAQSWCSRGSLLLLTPLRGIVGQNRCTFFSLGPKYRTEQAGLANIKRPYISVWGWGWKNNMIGSHAWLARRQERKRSSFLAKWSSHLTSATPFCSTRFPVVNKISEKLFFPVCVSIWDVETWLCV